MSGLNLNCNNWKSRKVTAPSAGYEAGQMIKDSDTVGVVVDDIAASADGVLIYSAEKITVPKATGIVLTKGCKVYFDAAAGNITTTSAGNTLCGRATVASGSSATEAQIDLNGDIEG